MVGEKDSHQHLDSSRCVIFRTVSTVFDRKTVETVKGAGAPLVTQLKQGVNEMGCLLIFSSHN